MKGTISGGTLVAKINASSATGAMNGNQNIAGSAFPRGEDGISPTVDVSEIEGGHRISINDISGTKTFDVMDGERGEQGEKGEDADEERVTNIEKAIAHEPYKTDDSVAYTKVVPENDLPSASLSAEVSMLGGMTYKDGDTLKSAKVTEVESVGVNLWEFGDVDIVSSSGYKNLALKNPLPVGTYTFSAIPHSTDNARQAMLVAFVGGGAGGANINIGINAGYLNAITATIETPVQYIRLCSGLSVSDSAGLTSSWTSITLNKGTTALPYTPYVRNTLPIPEAVQTLDGYGEGINESVYNYIDFEKKQFVKRVDKIVFDGTEAWRQQSVNALGFANYELSCMTNADTSVRSIAICNLFEHDTNWIANVTREGFLVDTKTVVYFRSKSYTTLDAWKAYLAELYAAGNPLTFVYATLTQVTDISDILKDNNVEVEGNGTLTFKNEHGYDVPSEVGYFVQINGNAASATKLETPRNINGVPFDGTSDITIEAGSGGGIPIVPAIFNTQTYMGYDATVEGVTELTDGMKLTIIPDKAPIMAYYSLNVNGLGAKSIYRTNEKGLPANDPMSQQGWGEAGVPVTITYSVKGSKWIADVPFPTPAGIGAIAMQGGMASGLKVEALLLTKNSDYGDSLPTSVGAAGRIFFKKVT